jgi:hypothetical protein
MQQNGVNKVHFQFAIQYLLSECRRYGASEIPEDVGFIDQSIVIIGMSAIRVYHVTIETSEEMKADCNEQLVKKKMANFLIVAELNDSSRDVT